MLSELKELNYYFYTNMWTIKEYTQYRIAGNFRGVQFCGWLIVTFLQVQFRGRTHSHPLCTVKQSSFHGFNFRSKTIIHENHENWTPRKFPTIWYITVCAP